MARFTACTSALHARALPISPGPSVVDLKQLRRLLRFAGVLKRVPVSGISRKTWFRQVTVHAYLAKDSKARFPLI